MSTIEKSEFLSDYKRHLQAKGFTFTKAMSLNKARKGVQQAEAGQWITGANGTYIFAYLQEGWPEGLIAKIFE
jgi:hypothetical protein